MPVGIHSISLTLTRTDAQGRSFETQARIWCGPDGSWQQWGGDTAQLGESVDLLEALTAAAAPHLVDDEQ